jgi:hypothetical protein
VSFLLLICLEGITKPAIRRLARRGGVKRISGLIYEEACHFPYVLTVDPRGTQGFPRGCHP